MREALSYPPNTVGVLPPESARDTVPVRRALLRRLLGAAVRVGILVVLGRSLLGPLVLGWERAERMLILEDELNALQRRHVALREEITYRRNAAGQNLTAAEVLAMTYPHARVVELVPRSREAISSPPPTLGERVSEWRERGRVCIYKKWRVLNLLLLGRRLPPDRTPSVTLQGNTQQRTGQPRDPSRS